MNDDELIKKKANRIRYVGLTGTIHTIVKNRKYGDAVRKTVEILRVLYPEGIRPDQYSDLLLLVRVQDKMVRIASYTPERRKKDDESPWADIRGYGTLGEEKDLDPNEEGIPPGEYHL
jgi:hypothetical protein